MKRIYTLLIGLSLLATSCEQDKTDMLGTVTGYKPIYGTGNDLFVIKSEAAQQVVNAGKIYVKDNYIYQNEIGQGIHITNNSNPANAQRVGFIKIKGSEELSIKGNYLYSNNFNDLVVIDISNISNVTEVKRIKDAFRSSNSMIVPPASNSYFECVDNSKGIVIGWKKDSIINPKCRN